MRFRASTVQAAWPSPSLEPGLPLTPFGRDNDLFALDGISLDGR